MSSLAEITPGSSVVLARAVPATLAEHAAVEETAISPQTLRGGLYLTVRYGLGVLVSVGNMLVLTWWIGPHDYGLFVTAIGLVTFFSSVARAGVDTYLVRCESDPSPRIYHIAGTLVLGISAGLICIGVALTPLLARWLGSSEFVGAYLVLLVTIPISGLAGVPMAKLDRELDFRRAASIELGGQVLGLIAAAVLALAGTGMWAPVVGQMGGQLFVLVSTYAAIQMPPRLCFDAAEARKMLGFGVRLTASLRTWQLRTLVNPLIVGHLAGPEGVAFVGVAIRIAESLGSIRLAAGRLAIATLARLQDRRQQFSAALRQAQYLQVIILGPLLCGFSLLGPWIVPRVMGMRWNASLTVYPFIAAGVLVNSVFNLQASALFVLGRQWAVLRAYAVHVALLAGGSFSLFSRFGLAGYGGAELLACAAYALIHRGLPDEVVAAYRKLAPWVALFVLLLFLPVLHLRLGISQSFIR